MGELPGKPKKLVMDGNTFFYMADADPAYGKPKWAITALPHSGGIMHQMILQDLSTTGHRVKCNGAELSLLKTLAEREDSYPISWTNRASDTYTCTGKITFESASAANGSVELTVIPETDWTEFLG